MEEDESLQVCFLKFVLNILILQFTDCTSTYLLSLLRWIHIVGPHNISSVYTVE